MAENSKIEWTTHTANLWHGCTKVHAGCDHCYAETLSKRWGHDIWGNDKPRKMIASFFKDLERYQKAAAAAGEMHRVFVGSMMDIFEKAMPLINSKGENVCIDGITGNVETHFLRSLFFVMIDKGSFPNLIFLLLTKRPSNINKYIPEGWKTNPPKNVWFGTSPVDQETADKLIPQLLQVNGNRFLSVEPMLGAIDFTAIGYADQRGLNSLTGELRYYRETDGECMSDWGPSIRWVIVGGESGHGRRPFDPEWARSIRAQCAEAEVPFFMKQIDKILPIPEDLLIRQIPAEFENSITK